MPTGFDLCATLRDDVNPFNHDQNCYFCTVAALKNIDVLNLVDLTETMQQNTATRDEIQRLFSDAGLPAKPFIQSGFNIKVAGATDGCNALQAKHVIETTVSSGKYCGVDFVRPDGTGHMVVAYRNRDHFGSIVYTDFQVPPHQRQEHPWPPESGHNFVYAIWLSTEIDDLCAQFAGLTINTDIEELTEQFSRLSLGN